MSGEPWPQLCLSLWERRGDTGVKLCQKSCGPPTTNHQCILSVCVAQWEHPRWGQKTMNEGTSWILSLSTRISVTAPSSGLAHFIIVGGPCEQIRLNIREPEECGKAHEALQTGGDKLTRLNWINGCVMCNILTTWAGAFVWRMCY